jgi:hypothetical protein
MLGFIGSLERRFDAADQPDDVDARCDDDTAETATTTAQETLLPPLQHPMLSDVAPCTDSSRDEVIDLAGDSDSDGGDGDDVSKYQRDFLI